MKQGLGVPILLALVAVATGQTMSKEEIRVRAGWKARLYVSLDASPHVKIS